MQPCLIFGPPLAAPSGLFLKQQPMLVKSVLSTSAGRTESVAKPIELDGEEIALCAS